MHKNVQSLTYDFVMLARTFQKNNGKSSVRQSSESILDESIQTHHMYMSYILYIVYYSKEYIFLE